MPGRLPRAAERRSVGRRTIEAESTFALIAELAVGLAGFGGVAAAFGGRDRSYAPVELTRMRALFAHAALVLASSLLATSLLWFGLDLSQACFWSSALGLAGEVPAAAYFSSRAYQYVVDPKGNHGLVRTIAYRHACLGGSRSLLGGLEHRREHGFPYSGALRSVAVRLMAIHQDPDATELAPSPPNKAL